MSNPRTFEQASHLLRLAEDKNISLEQLQLLYNLGLLSDLFEAAATVDLTCVNREDYKRVLGFDPLIFRVNLGGPETTDEIVSGLGFLADMDITQANFPLRPHDPEEVEIEIIDPYYSFSEDEGLAILAMKKLGRPTYEHALRFAQQYGMTTSERKPSVIFLHEAWQDRCRERRVFCMTRCTKYRKLSLGYPDVGFHNDYYVLAGVRPCKQPSAA